MKAYNLAMALIFINAGFAIMYAISAFKTYSTEVTSVYSGPFDQLLTLLASPVAVTGLSISIVAASVFLAISGKSTEGISVGAFTATFWGSMGTSLLVIYQIGKAFDGLGIFISVLVLASTLIFVMALIQMPIGGRKGDV